MPNLRLRYLAPREHSNWPEVLKRQATFTALDSWHGLVQRLYEFPTYRLETLRDRQVTGILTITQIQHPFFGRYLTTAPFGSFGGLAYLDKESRNLLLSEAGALATRLNVRYANVRFQDDHLPSPPGWIQHPIYCTYLVDISCYGDSLLINFSSHHRNHIRKSLKKGFNIEFGHLDLLNDAYEVLVQAMHELGSPYHAKTYLEEMASMLGNTLQFAVVYSHDKKPAGAGAFIGHGDMVTMLHANVLRAHRPHHVGEFFYWKVFEHYHRHGFKTMDLGRSRRESGNEMFKMKWGPRKQPLAYWYALRPGARLPNLNPYNPKLAPGISVWKRLPRFVTRACGPLLIRGLA
jgi:FemAB-related protein (PEP-CTERM system-associated)